MNQHAVRLQAAECLEPRQLAARLSIHTLGEVNEERRLRRGRPPPQRHVAARLASSAGFAVLQEKRMRPPIPAHHPDRQRAPHLGVERVVMRNRRHAGQHILEAADEQPFDERVGARGADRRIARQPLPDVGDPARGILVAVASFDAAVVVQLEMVVGVDEAWQHDAALQIDDGVAVPWRIADRQHAGRETDRWRNPIARRDARVHQRDGVCPDHDGFTA